MASPDQRLQLVIDFASLLNAASSPAVTLGGWDIYAWRTYAERKARIASSVCKENGKLKRLVFQSDPLLSDDPWSSSLWKSAAPACHQSAAEAWSNYKPGVHKDFDATQSHCHSVCPVAEEFRRFHDTEGIDTVPCDIVELKEDDAPAAIPNTNGPPRGVELIKLIVPLSDGKVADDKLAPVVEAVNDADLALNVEASNGIPAKETRNEISSAIARPDPSAQDAADASAIACPFKAGESILLKDAVGCWVPAVCLSPSFQANGFIKVRRNDGTTMACSPSILRSMS